MGLPNVTPRRRLFARAGLATLALAAVFASALVACIFDQGNAKVNDRELVTSTASASDTTTPPPPPNPPPPNPPPPRDAGGG